MQQGETQDALLPAGAGRPPGETLWRRLLCYAVPVATILFARVFLPVDICDDAFISFKVALNAASGRGMVFNPGEDTYVSTSPAWVLLLATARLPAGDVVLAARGLGALCELLLVMAVVRLGEDTQSGPEAGMFGALLLATNPVFLLTSFSGMELPLYLLVIVLTASCLAQRRHALAMALAAGALWIRFDGIVVLAVAAALVLRAERGRLRVQPAAVLAVFAPALLIVLAYVLFGMALFETWLPMSVQRKALTTAGLFSPAWLAAAGAVALEFVMAMLGKSAYWYLHDTAYPYLVLPFLVGVILLVRRRLEALTPLLLITLAHAAAFTLSGSAYAVNFPWYFAPVLPVVCLICGAGVTRILSFLLQRPPLLGRARRRGIVSALAVFGWLAMAVPPLQQDAAGLARVWAGERERVYASAAVWAGRHIGEGAVVAANEIGALGFFLPPPARVLDMFGLLRRQDTLRDTFVQRVRQERPHCIFTRRHFTYMQALRAVLPGAYDWFRFRTLNVGIRADLSRVLRPHLQEFPAIYRTIAIDREPRRGAPAEE